MIKNKTAAIIYGSLNDIHLGAPGHVILDTIRHLPRTNHFEWSVFYHNYKFKLEVINGIEVKGIPHIVFDTLVTKIIRLLPQSVRKQYFVTSNPAFIRYLISIVRVLFFLRPDVVVVHVSYPLPRMIRMILPSSKILYYHHGSTMHSKLNEKQWMNLEKSCDGIIAVSQAAFDGIINTFKNIAVRHWVVYNGSSLILRPSEDVETARNAIRAKFQFDGKIVFIFCGRLVASKGIIPLVRAFQKLNGMNYSVALLLVGDANVGQDERDHENAIDHVRKLVALGKGAVVHTGWVEKDQVADYIAASDIAVLPSLAPEGISLFAVDSLALGKPLIATDTGGNKEVAIHERTGLLISSSKETIEEQLLAAMERLLIDKTLFQNCSLGALEVSQSKFNVGVMASSFVNVMNQVCAE